MTDIHIINGLCNFIYKLSNSATKQVTRYLRNLQRKTVHFQRKTMQYS